MKPSILYNFFRDGATMDALREGLKICRKLVAQPAFAPHLEREVDPGPEVESDGAIDAFIRQTVGTLFHPVGTCSMGTGPDAVVDPGTHAGAWGRRAAGDRCVGDAGDRFGQHDGGDLCDRGEGGRSDQGRLVRSGATRCGRPLDPPASG